MHPTVALCAVVYNERHRIESFIESCGYHVDELCIVDQSSTDGTWEWLTEHRAEMGLRLGRDRHWGFAEPSRQQAHELSSAEWVLVLDVDERLDPEYAKRLTDIPTQGYLGARLTRALYVGGEHRYTGDRQYRFFRRDAVRYVPELHWEPQPTVPAERVLQDERIAIIHEKSWVEQIRDDVAYEALLEGDDGEVAERKRALNIHLHLLRAAGITAEAADAMTPEERAAAGLSLPVDYRR